jgi:methionine sulfoxide reductase heme-binding subunit
MDETLIRVGIRATARTSFVLFLSAFLSAPLYRLWPATTTRWLKGNQGRFTLGFAASHAVHLAFILTLVASFGARAILGRGWAFLIPFVTGFPFIYALAFAVLIRDRKVWVTSPHFEAFAHYLLLTIFTFAFAFHSLTNPLFYAPFVLAAIASLVVRLTSVATSRKIPALTSNTQPHS